MIFVRPDLPLSGRADGARAGAPRGSADEFWPATIEAFRVDAEQSLAYFEYRYIRFRSCDPGG